jgi:hypothetical protein
MDHEHKGFVLTTKRPNCNFELSSNVTYPGFRVSRLPTVLNIYLRPNYMHRDSTWFEGCSLAEKLFVIL